jgi:WD40 repeat protein
MNLENHVRATVHDMAEQARPVILGPGALARARRIRRRRMTAAVASCAAVLAVAVATPVLLTSGGMRQAGGGSGAYFVGNLDGGGDALDVAVSPDGQTLAAAGGNAHSVVLWSARTGQAERTLTGISVVAAVAFSPDSGRVASDSEVFNPITGERVCALSPAAYDVAFSPDGTLVATADGYNQQTGVRLYDSSTGALRRTLTTDYSNALAFSPDGTLLATTNLVNGGVTLWRVDTGEKVNVIDTSQPEDVAFSPDGRLLATSGSDGTHLWNPTSGAHMRDLPAATALAFSPDGSILAGAAPDGPVQFFDPATGGLLRTLSGVQARGFAFSPDGQRIIVGDGNGHVQVIALS